MTLHVGGTSVRFPEDSGGDSSFTIGGVDVSWTDGETLAARVSRPSENAVSTDATLASLTVSGATLSPAFDAGVLVYRADVGADTEAVTLSATTADGGATVSYVPAEDADAQSAVGPPDCDAGRRDPGRGDGDGGGRSDGADVPCGRGAAGVGVGVGVVRLVGLHGDRGRGAGDCDGRTRHRSEARGDDSADGIARRRRRGGRLHGGRQRDLHRRRRAVADGRGDGGGRRHGRGERARGARVRESAGRRRGGDRGERRGGPGGYRPRGGEHGADRPAGDRRDAGGGSDADGVR